MNEESIEMYVDDSGSYLESLVKSRIYLKDLSPSKGSHLVAKMEELLLLEIDLAILGAEKAKSEILKKQSSEDKVRPIK